MQMATMKIDNLDLFGFANMQAIEQQREKNELKRIETMKLVRCDWFIAVTSTGELFKYSEKVPAKYKAFKGIKLFKCWNEATADLVLNAVKGAIKGDHYEIPDVKKSKKFTVNSWVRNIDLKFLHLPVGQLTNLYREHQERLRLKREKARLKENENTYDVEPH